MEIIDKILLQNLTEDDFDTIFKLYRLYLFQLILVQYDNFFLPSIIARRIETNDIIWKPKSRQRGWGKKLMVIDGRKIQLQRDITVTWDAYMYM